MDESTAANYPTCDLCKAQLQRANYLEVSNIIDGQRHRWRFCHVCVYSTTPTADEKQRLDELFKRLLGMNDEVDSIARH